MNRVGGPSIIEDMYIKGIKPFTYEATLSIALFSPFIWIKITKQSQMKSVNNTNYK